MKCKRNSDGRTLDHVSLQTMRIQAVKAVSNGEPPRRVARAFGVNVRSVYRWLAAFASGGQQALEAKEIPGRPAKLTEEHLRWLARAVRNTTPQQYCFEFALWTLSLIGALLEKEFGLKVSRSTLGRAMHALGFTPQRPLYKARERDPALVAAWERERFPAIAREAKRLGALILFADEAGMRSDHHAGRTWAPLGKTPTVRTTGQRFGVNMRSAVGAKGELYFMIHDGRVNAAVFVQFLRRLRQDIDRPIFLIVDGHSIHNAALVKAYLAEQQDQVRLFPLPAYSPHLNPDEQVWGNVKSRVAKATVTSKIDLLVKLDAALQRLREMPQLVAGFFRHPHCAYILEAIGAA